MEKNTEEELQHMGVLFFGSTEEECSEESNEEKQDYHLDQMQSRTDSVESKQLHNIAQKYEVEILARNGSIKFKIGTGADVSVTGVEHLEKFGLRLRDLRRTKKSLVGPDANKLKCLGYLKANFKTKDQFSNQICYVCKNIKIPLLGRPAFKELRIVKINVPSQVTCASVTTQQSNESDTGHTQDSIEFVKEFPEVLNGLGKIKGDPVRIELKDGNTPFI